MTCQVELWPSSLVPPMSDLISGAGYAGLFLLTFVLAEVGKRRLALPVEVTRKFVHLGSGVLVAMLPCFFKSMATVVVLSLSFFAILVASRALGLLSSVHGVERRSAGAYVYPLSVLGVLVLSGGGGVSFSIPVLVLAFSDAFAAVVGKAYGRVHFRIYDQTRSLEGSTAFLVTTFIVIHVPLLLSGRVGPPESLLIALLLAFVVTCFEAIAVRGYDNVLIPVATLFALERMIPHSLEVLVERALALGIIVAVGFMTFRRRRLTVAGLLGALLLAYGAFALGGPAWLLPLVAFYFTYNVGVPLDREPGPRRAEYGRDGDEDLNNIRRVFYIFLIPTLALLIHAALPHPAVYGAFLAVVAFIFSVAYGLFGDLRVRLYTPDEARGTRFSYSPGIVIWGLIGVAVCTGTAVVAPGALLRTAPAVLVLAPGCAAVSFLLFVLSSRWLLAHYHCEVCGKGTTQSHCHHTPAKLVRPGRFNLDFDRAFFVFNVGSALLFLAAYGAADVLGIPMPPPSSHAP